MRNTEGPKRTPTWRLLFVMFVVFSIAGGLVYRLAHLAIGRRAFLVGQGESRMVRDEPLPALRAMIVDRNQVPLAVSTQTQSLWVNPRIMEMNTKAWRNFAEAIPMAVADLKALVHKHKHQGFVYIKRGLSPDACQRIVAQKYKGVHCEYGTKRYYPDGESTAHIVGRTNIDDRGIEGLELSFNRWLSGQSGRRQVIKDLKGHVVEELGVTHPAKPGHPLRLSIDHEIQFLVYEALKKGVVQAEAKSGEAIVLDAHTGEILALANYPSFNPNRREKNSGFRVRNRAITDVFEPGSTMKAFSVLSALSSGKYTAESTIDTNPGKFYVDGHLIQDEGLNRGVITVQQTIQKSSNIAIAKMTLASPPEQLWNLYHQLGFGERPGAEMPGESPGLFKARRVWRDFDLATLSFGYGISVTALQLARAMNVIASGGLLYPASILYHATPVQGLRIVPKALADAVLSMLESVTQFGGTGWRAQVPGFRVAGKTGTAYVASPRGGYDKQKFTGSFLGVGPLPNPKYTVLVVIHEPNPARHFGGLIAAPVFSRIMSYLLK